MRTHQLLHVGGTPPRVLAGDVEGRAGEAGDPTVSWKWDGEQLRAESDPLGFLPLFYWATDSEVVVGTSLIGVLEGGAPLELDYEGLAVFLRLGYFIGDRTAIAAVRILPPDGRLTWRRGAWSVTGDAPVRRAAIDMPREALVEEYGRRFAAAMEARPARGQVLMPLSGGRDSRHILGELLRRRVPVASVLTIARTEPDPDVAAARALTASLGLAHEVVPVIPNTLERETDKNRRTHFGADEHAWFLPLVDDLASRGGTVYDGIGGDVLSESKNLTAERLALMRAGRLEELALDLMAFRAEDSLRAAATPEFYSRVPLALAVAALTEELRRHRHAPNPVGSFLFWNRARREIALMPFALLQHDELTIRTPYLDAGLFEFLASIPGEQLLDKTLHTATIARATPAVGTLPYAESYPGARHGRLHYYLTGRLPARRLIGEVRRAGTIDDLLTLRPGRYLFDRQMHYEWFAAYPAYLHGLRTTLGDIAAGRDASAAAGERLPAPATAA